MEDVITPNTIFSLSKTALSLGLRFAEVEE
jgi:hypothetical protein